MVAESEGRLAIRLGNKQADRYGRTLAHLYDRQGRNLQGLMLSEGLGYHVAIAPDTALLECLRQAETQARSMGRGLWRDPPVQHADRLIRSGFALIEGRVESARHNRGGVWLELNGALVVWVAPSELETFDLAWLQGLRGRRIEVRGWVVGRNRSAAGAAGWLLPLSHPTMLRIL